MTLNGAVNICICDIPHARMHVRYVYRCTRTRTRVRVRVHARGGLRTYTGARARARVRGGNRAQALLRIRTWRPVLEVWCPTEDTAPRARASWYTYVYALYTRTRVYMCMHVKQRVQRVNGMRSGRKSSSSRLQRCSAACSCSIRYTYVRIYTYIQGAGRRYLFEFLFARGRRRPRPAQGSGNAVIGVCTWWCELENVPPVSRGPWGARGGGAQW